jgi:hypothetical protein
MLAAISTAQAGPVTCIPKPLGSGTAALFKSNSRGDFATWYCPGESLPSMVVCLKATCSLVGTKRALAAIASTPTLAGLNEAIKPYTRDPLRDPDLVKVWAPHADEIRKLAD